MNYYGIGKRQYDLAASPLGQGGEGDIYAINGDVNKVAKVYHNGRITKEIEEKIVLMAKNPPSDGVLNQVAWPVDAIYDDYNNFVGFVMPKLDITSELGDVYVYPPRQNISFAQKLILAQNICVVIHEVHKAGYVFGDFNPKNIGINLNTGSVAFLDTDSYHIVLDNLDEKAYRCNVCLDGYVAPELLEKCENYKRDAYANAPLPTFTMETDNFALAIHIFRLLMNGYTPFNGIKETDSVSTASPGVGNQAIKHDNYCFKSGNKPQSVAVPPLNSLPDEIQALFQRAFIDGKNDPKKRPSAIEWHKALENFENQLEICRRNNLHMYKKGLGSCPWCDADERYKISISPTLNQKSFGVPVTPIVTPPPASAQNYNSSPLNISVGGTVQSSAALNTFGGGSGPASGTYGSGNYGYTANNYATPVKQSQAAVLDSAYSDGIVNSNNFAILLAVAHAWVTASIYTTKDWEFVVTLLFFLMVYILCEFFALLAFRNVDDVLGWILGFVGVCIPIAMAVASVELRSEQSPWVNIVIGIALCIFSIVFIVVRNDAEGPKATKKMSSGIGVLLRLVGIITLLGSIAYCLQPLYSVESNENMQAKDIISHFIQFIGSKVGAIENIDKLDSNTNIAIAFVGSVLSSFLFGYSKSKLRGFFLIIVYAWTFFYSFVITTIKYVQMGDYSRANAVIAWKLWIIIFGVLGVAVIVSFLIGNNRKVEFRK